MIRLFRTAHKNNNHNQTQQQLYDEDTLQSITPESDLRVPHRHVHVVTTAALPWFTGTAVNPLLRAFALSNSPYRHNVTLVLPWLELESDQRLLYKQQVFHSPQQQEAYIREWLSEVALSSSATDNNGTSSPNVDSSLNIIWYPARYHKQLGSIFAMGDMLSTIQNSSTVLDVCILEEPEHTNWYRAPGSYWTEQFQFVVGIIHTNYKEYAASHYSGLWTAKPIEWLSAAMVRAYCHKVIKLSDTLQEFAPEKSCTCNVHGVRDVFFENNVSEKSGVYYIGKLLWAKGLDLLLELEEYYKSYMGEYFSIDIFGSGPDEDAIRAAFHGRNTTKFPQTFAELRKSPIPARFPGRVDHSILKQHKIFINPSLSEVLCTTTAEALAMGKFVIVPFHPSNEFFYQFPNCLVYKSKLEFVANIKWAQSHEPEPLSDHHRNLLSWEAATERLIDSSATTVYETLQREKYAKLDEIIAKFHNELGKGEFGDLLRKLLGAGPVSHQVQYTKQKEGKYKPWSEAMNELFSELLSDLSSYSIQ